MSLIVDALPDDEPTDERDRQQIRAEDLNDFDEYERRIVPQSTAGFLE